LPKVRNLIKDFFKKPLKTDVNPDESVSMGAAIQAAVLSGGIKDILLLDVTPLSLGLETMGGVMTKIIGRNTTVPTKKTQIFSTAVDNQSSVTIRVYQGEREKAASNKLLGQFDLHDIPSAPRGVPQIEVTFDIDANGILHVSAKDKATNKQHGVDIKGSSSLSEDEVSRMVADAKKNEDSDRDFRELGVIKNNADTLIYTTERTLKDCKDVDPGVIESVKECISKLKSVMETENKLEIEKCMESLTSVTTKLTSINQDKDVGGTASKASDTAEGVKSDNVVEAEFVDTTNTNKDK
jgi:molecular chaperone DnaK